MPRTRARIYSGAARNVAALARQLQAGELVAVPTETVYGLAANALDAAACAKIFRAKGRPTNDPLIVHIHSLAQLDLISRPNAAALKVARAFWPGPLTIVLPKQKSVPDIVTSGRDSVAVRMPRHPLFRRLLKLSGLPLAAPSANPFGYISPTSAEHVRQNLGSRIRYILDGGASHIGVESTILDLRDPSRPSILRPGAVTPEQLSKVLGRRVTFMAKRGQDAEKSAAQVAPGMLARHYSPRTPVELHDRLPNPTHAGTKRDQAFVYLRRPAGSQPPNVFWFDARGSTAGIARKLFATLRNLDAKKFLRIHIERAPSHGLGAAINDRLTRAAAR